jgi:hypothetical protein
MSLLINPYRFAAAGATDPNFSNVSLLLHGDGTNGSTTITDSSGSPKTVTAFGNAQISTARSKFGNASIAFDGTGDYLGLGTGNTAYQFGSGNWTVEGWIYRLNTNSSVFLVGQSDLSTPTGSGYVFYVGPDNSSVYVGSSAFSIASPNPSANQWAHVAYVRNGGVFSSYLNGSLVASRSNLGSLSINNGATTFQASIGGFADGNVVLNGYIDDLRVTKGVARYTANFTPPTSPFPNS